MNGLGEDDVNLGMLKSLISTIVNNADPTATNEDKIKQANDMMNKAKSYDTVSEAFNGILSDATQKMNKAEGDYGKQQGAAGKQRQ